MYINLVHFSQLDTYFVKVEIATLTNSPLYLSCPEKFLSTLTMLSHLWMNEIVLVEIFEEEVGFVANI